MDSSYFRLLRCFFPSWRFFEDVGTLPLLEYRVSEGDWIRALPPQRRTLVNTFFNPDGNLQFATHSLVELLFMEAQELLEAGRSTDEIMSTVSYGLVCRLIVSKMRERRQYKEGLSIQFRLVGDQSPHELLFQSAIHGWEQICSF